MLFSKTVDGIIADIQKKVEQLGIVSEAKKLEAEAHDEVVKLKTEAAAFARKEVARAEAIAAKLKALIEG